MKKIIIVGFFSLLLLGICIFSLLKEKPTVTASNSRNIHPDASLVVEIEPKSILKAVDETLAFINDLTSAPFLKRVFGETPKVEVPPEVRDITSVRIIGKGEGIALELKSNSAHKLKALLEERPEVIKVSEYNYIISYDNKDLNLEFKEDGVIGLFQAKSIEDFYIIGDGLDFTPPSGASISYFIDREKASLLFPSLAQHQSFVKTYGDVSFGNGVKSTVCQITDKEWGEAQRISISETASVFQTLISDSSIMGIGFTGGYIRSRAKVLKLYFSNEIVSKVIKDKDVKEALDRALKHESLISDFPFTELNLIIEAQNNIPDGFILLSGPKSGADQFLVRLKTLLDDLELPTVLSKDNEGRDLLLNTKTLPLTARYLSDGSVLISQPDRELTRSNPIDYYNGSYLSHYLSTKPLIGALTPFTAIYSLQNPQEFRDFVKKLHFKVGSKKIGQEKRQNEFCHIINVNVLG
jgi:hypothetical protein